MSIIEIRETENVEKGVGKQWKKIKFCGIPILEHISTTTNRGIITQLASIKVDDKSTSSKTKPRMGFQIPD